MYALALVLLLCGGGALSAQQYYTPSTGTGTYTELADAVLVSDMPDTVGYGVSIPFTIEAFGVPLDFQGSPATVYIFSGGFIAMAPADRIYSFDAFVSVLAWRDNTSSISYRLDGVPGQQVLKVQWKNMRMVGNPDGDFVNVQMWLNQKDNSMEVHVGPNHVTGTAAYYSYTGPAIGGFVASADFSVYYNTFHLTGNPAKPGTDRKQGYYPMGGTPAEGTIYHFSYKAPSSVDERVRDAAAVGFIPNPCADRSRIELPADMSGTHPTLIVHDLLGRELLRVDNVASGDYIERGGLAPGAYVVTLRDGDRVRDGGMLMVR
ncbi:MAG: C-terminal target protein [Chlorobi bacterium]|nr:C-terminal target protein [Chlorobiota bacterium]